MAVGRTNCFEGDRTTPTKTGGETTVGSASSQCHRVTPMGLVHCGRLLATKLAGDFGTGVEVRDMRSKLSSKASMSMTRILLLPVDWIRPGDECLGGTGGVQKVFPMLTLLSKFLLSRGNGLGVELRSTERRMAKWGDAVIGASTR